MIHDLKISFEVYFFAKIKIKLIDKCFMQFVSLLKTKNRRNTFIQNLLKRKGKTFLWSFFCCWHFLHFCLGCQQNHCMINLLNDFQMCILPGLNFVQIIFINCLWEICLATALTDCHIKCLLVFTRNEIRIMSQIVEREHSKWCVWLLTTTINSHANC